MALLLRAMKLANFGIFATCAAKNFLHISIQIVQSEAYYKYIHEIQLIGELIMRWYVFLAQTTRLHVPKILVLLSLGKSKPFDKDELLHLLSVLAKPPIASLVRTAPRFQGKKLAPSTWSSIVHLMAWSLRTWRSQLQVNSSSGRWQWLSACKSFLTSLLCIERFNS